MVLMHEKNDLGLDESTMRQAMVFFRESKHILMANMSAIGSGSVWKMENIILFHCN